MPVLSQSSYQFVKHLSDFAERLANMDFTISNLNAMHANFGCWEIIISRSHTAIKFFWDGRDKYLTIEASPQRNFSAPNEWEQQCAEGFQSSDQEEIFLYIENYLKKNILNK